MNVAARIADSLAQVDAFIDQQSQRVADQRAQEIARVAGGIIELTPEQHAALKEQAASELARDFAEQVASITNTFTVNKG